MEHKKKTNDVVSPWQFLSDIIHRQRAEAREYRRTISEQKKEIEHQRELIRKWINKETSSYENHGKGIFSTGRSDGKG